MRAKFLMLLGVALCGALALIAGSQPWVSFMLDGTHSLETVSGNAANPAIAPIAIALVAAALALTIAGQVFRRVLGVLIAALGAGLAALSIGVVSEPFNAIAGRVTELTGLSGGSPGAGIAWESVGGWAYLSVVAGIVAAVFGLLVTFLSGRWAAAGRKYDSSPRPAAPAAGSDRISDWDALSGGDDPTAEER